MINNDSNIGVNKRKPKDKKLVINFDVSILNSLIRYTRCEYVSTFDLNTLYKLMSQIDPESYKKNDAVYDRIKVLNVLLKSLIEEGIKDEDMLKTAIKDNYPEGLNTIEDVGFRKNSITAGECDKLTKNINARMQTISIDQNRDAIINTLSMIDAAQFSDEYYHLIEDLRTQLMDLVGDLQVRDHEQGLLRDFSFSMTDAAAIINRVVNKAKRPAAVLQTGIRQLNAILSPGFQAGRMYTFIGASGRFKSGTLLNMADQIRRFNPQIPAYENGLRKCILFITLENSIEETFERIFDMYSGLNDDIRTMSMENILDILRTTGQFAFNNSSGIDIYFKYAGNLEINTNAIHLYIKDLRDKGYQPIAVVLDYIKRIDSVHNSMGDERVRMSFVAKELKVIAQFYEIPMITAMQLNREGNSIIDAAMRENKQDVARFVGSSSIGNAWDIVEDSDWVGLINLEMQKSTNQLFLTFKRLKIRSKKVNNTVDYFNHPFESDKNIRLMTDVDKERPVSVISLATDLESIDEQEGAPLPTMKRLTLDEIRSNSHSKVLSTLNQITH